MAALEEVLKTPFIIFCLMEISLSIENGKLHKRIKSDMCKWYIVLFSGYEQISLLGVLIFQDGCL
jgi:hypothetical protein